jgi:diguanylate cyclase (GGDEF)-like protein
MMAVIAGVMYLTIEEHKTLYKESVVRNLTGLSENMSDELVSILSTEPDLFRLTTTLLKLDRYEDVQYASIYDVDWQTLQNYVSPSFSQQQDALFTYTEEEIRSFPLGVSIQNDVLVSVHRIGEEAFSQGYLLIVHSFQGPIEESTFHLFLSAAPLVMLLMFIAIASSLWAYRYLLNPLHDLSIFAMEVEKTNNYGLRSKVKGQGEVAQLTQNINGMLNTIEQQIDRNKAFTDQLLEQQSSMERLANHDSLTGLPNRQFFMKMLRYELVRAERYSEDISIMFFDLDGFKTVNDALGHEVGDLLLIEASKKIKNYLRDGDLLARLGGDEFLILLPHNPKKQTLTNIAERIIEGMREPFQIGEWQVQTGVSIGIANASDASFELNQFISYADIAMYRSKINGRGVYTLFEEGMLEDNKRKLLIANAIIPSLEQDHFYVMYQPKVDLKGEIVGFEALIRWQHPELGAIFPDEFIPIAERSGRISSLTQWIISRVLQDLPAIEANVCGNCVTAINLSAHDIKNPNFIQFVKSAFEKYDVNPQCLEFEVTESAYLENLDSANLFFKDITQMGSTIALDDFGTGYSSLGYLTQININTLKIDKSFVEHVGVSEKNTVIIQTIIDMARHLNLRVCAEGVENDTQYQFLISCGCDQLQGYFFGKPARLGAFTQESKK